MNIRTITYFVDPGFPVIPERLASAGRVITTLRAALQEAGYSVQTARLATPPCSRLAPAPGQVVPLAQQLEAACFINDIDYATLGPARIDDAPAFYDALPDAVGATQSIMASAVIADPVQGLSLAASRQAARVIDRCARLAADGFANLRFCALANVPAGTPFFPAAYHEGSTPVVSIGVEAAEAAVRVVNEAASLGEARARLVESVEGEAQRISKIAKGVGGPRGLHFGGLDFSLAPYPEAARSIGTALERLSGGRVGEHGTLAAVAFLADSLDRARYKRTGFSGVFLPVFEDAVLAARAAEGRLTLNDLLLYSSVCGTGLDTIPLPGDTPPESLAAVLLDVGALALRLNKPLTARLMPIPGKQAGDPVAFDFAYFAPTRVLSLRTDGLAGLFAGEVVVPIAPRPG